MSERTITRLLADWSRGDEQAGEALASTVYAELLRLAESQLRRERREPTLDPRGLVHEAYLRLSDQRCVAWKNRRQFYGLAALMMRRILVEHARSRDPLSRGKHTAVLPLAEASELADPLPFSTLTLEDALARLRVLYPQASEVTELRFFGGLREPEIARRLGLSVPTVRRRWRLARAWLCRHLLAEVRDDAG